MKLLLVITSSLVVLHTSAHAQGFPCCYTQVLDGNDSLDANSSSLAPFSYGGSRYQQIFSGPQFVGPSITGGIWLSNVAFRVDASGPGWAGAYSGIQINLSTAQVQPNSLSPVFANNVGLNAATVFAGSWSGLVSWPSSPGTFGLQINFSQGFFYRPADGNLLLDIRMSGNGINPSRLDASQGWPETASLFSSAGGASGTLSDITLVTQFGGQLVPEPSTYALIGLGAAGFLLLAKKKRR